MLYVVAIAAVVIALSVLLGFVATRLDAYGTQRARVARRVLGVALLAVYVAVVLNETLLGRSAAETQSAEFELFWSYRASLALAEDGLSVTDASLLAEIFLNILLFVPLGALLPFTFPELFERVWFVLLAAVLCTCAIELTQLHLHLGLFEFDDILNNSLGALAGFGLYRVTKR